MKRYPVIVFLLSVLIAAGSGVAQTATGQEDKEKTQHYLYEWMDDNGTVHISDDLGDVPEQYRRQVRKRLEQPAKEETGRQEQVTPQPAPQLEEGRDQEAQKEEWQQRIGEWKERLADAEKRRDQLDKERSALINTWGILINAPLEIQNRVRQIDEEMKGAQKDIDDARNMIDVVIPEEARKAGAQPGWLRE